MNLYLALALAWALSVGAVGWWAYGKGNAVALSDVAQRALEEERRRVDALHEVGRLAARSREIAAADARRASDAGRMLHQSARDFASAPATNGGETTGGTGLVLAELFIGADETAGELAAALDQARIAGLTCERAYDSLREGK